MRVTAIPSQTPRNRLDRSVRRAEKRHCRALMLWIRYPIRPAPGVCATADAPRGEKHLPDGQVHGNLGVTRSATWETPVLDLSVNTPNDCRDQRTPGGIEAP
jgi:hypothetical protein